MGEPISVGLPFPKNGRVFKKVPRHLIDEDWLKANPEYDSVCYYEASPQSVDTPKSANNPAGPAAPHASPQLDIPIDPVLLNGNLQHVVGKPGVLAPQDIDDMYAEPEEV